jgi:interferon gamma-inducible protein 30
MQNKYYALIYCIEFLTIEGRHSNWQSCFSSLGLPEKPILDCYNNGTGAKVAPNTFELSDFPILTFLL